MCHMVTRQYEPRATIRRHRQASLPGIRPLGKPLRIGPGVIRAWLQPHPAWPRRTRARRWPRVRPGADRRSRSPRVPGTTRPRSRVRDLGEFHRRSRGSSPSAGGARQASGSAGQCEPADSPPLVYPPPAGHLPAALADADHRERTTSAKTPCGRGHGPPPRGSPGCPGTPSPPMPDPRGPSPTARANAD